jgi:holo-[acyl-carrier protein] synthase
VTATTTAGLGWRPRVGADLADVTAVSDSVARFGQRYLRRVFTDAELAACAGRDRDRRLAARFAAKEATAKVLGVGDAPWSWRDVEVVREADGRPALALHGAAAALAARTGVADLDLTLSHERDLALAVVTALARTDPSRVPADVPGGTGHHRGGER